MPNPGDPYFESVYQTFAETVVLKIFSSPIPDVGLDLELNETDLTPDTAIPTSASIWAGLPTLQLERLDFVGTNATFLSCPALGILHAGDLVHARYTRPAAGGMTLDVYGTWRAKAIPPPPPLGVWCEPFLPTDAEIADLLYTAHLDRMDALSVAF